MWMFTRYGFFSVVLARKLQDGIPTNEVDPDTVMVRARCYEHLENLKQHFKELATSDIQESTGTDYRYRMILPKSVWVNVLTQMGNELNYTNYKAVCARSPLTDRTYDQLLHKVWRQHYELQDE